MQMSQNQFKDEVEFPGLPLAVYREIAAHLQQVDGVEAGLYPAAHQQFDYSYSQIGGLWIQYDQHADLISRERVAQILAYYQNCYGAFRKLNSATE
ncbi:acyltransferase [Gloeocapsopsis sp. IPPAS B-1203]|uniref:acyltransferase n=1 Tax=Gloeocapsopsis sp. IPPAS B-1203 TaxID=2049454 RepID=UPI000C19BFAE|nr:acyltransferase [Gloeocapsopsis sp. IPPAS B-1203]PIG91041.1 acyltransferase [Gloeocapsopsis sp. IPPAS B-1203]